MLSPQFEINWDKWRHLELRTKHSMCSQCKNTLIFGNILEVLPFFPYTIHDGLVLFLGPRTNLRFCSQHYLNLGAGLLGDFVGHTGLQSQKEKREGDKL